MRRADFHYVLPGELIARYPAGSRSASRLLCLDGATGGLADRHFAELPGLLQRGDLLVFNDTRVLCARLFGFKASGGRVELLVERILDPPDTALVHLRASKKPRVGTEILVEPDVRVVVTSRHDDLWQVQFPAPVADILERVGHVPLPPYISRADELLDRERYQTVYARHPGAVAAPTAGLHFDQPLLERLDEHGVELAYLTLHVGAGTFQPLRSDDLDEHVMHSERIRVDAALCSAVQRTRDRGGRVIAVGTTVVRTLESSVRDGQLQACETETSLFIRPGFNFQVVDALVTNFHLPESTLLMLVSAFAGHANIMRAYQHAVDKRYRFFSYGDAMFMTRENHAV